MPRVSVIIPTYNRPHLLPRAVESVRMAGKDIEIIVVDDASTDNTSEVCKSIGEIKYIRLSQNHKVAGARNAGILASSAEYICFLDDDDLRLPGSLDLQAKILDDTPETGLVYGQTYYGDQECNPTGSIVPETCLQGDIFWDLLGWMFFLTQSVVFRKTCLARIGLLDVNLAGVDDWDLWIRIAAQFPVAAVETPVAVWRKPTSSSGQGSSNWISILKAAELAQKKGLGLPRATSAPSSQRNLVRRRFINTASDSLIFRAATALKEGSPKLAQKQIWASFQWNWLRAMRPLTWRLLLCSSIERHQNSSTNSIVPRSIC